MKLIERGDLQRVFPDFHNAFLGDIAAQHLAQNLSVSALRKVIDLKPLVADVKARASVLRGRQLTTEQRGYYFAFGQEVLRGVVALAGQYGLERVPSARPGMLTTPAIELVDSQDNPRWRAARASLEVSGLMRDSDLSELDLEALQQPPETEQAGQTPRVWQFGLDVYGYHHNPPLHRSHSPGSWYRATQYSGTMIGEHLHGMYDLAYTLEVVRDHLPPDTGQLPLLSSAL